MRSVLCSPVGVYVRSATQSRSGASASKLRSTRSSGLAASSSGMVVRFFSLISSRYERRSLIVTSNKNFSAWAEIFGDAVAVAAMVDRLVHHAQVIVLKGQSYRLRGKRKEVTHQPPTRPRSFQPALTAGTVQCFSGGGARSFPVVAAAGVCIRSLGSGNQPPDQDTDRYTDGDRDQWTEATLLVGCR